jgi:hypothetical protein
MYDVETWKTSGHWEKFKDEMFLVPRRGPDARPQADELPGHMLCSETTLRSYRGPAQGTPRRRHCTGTSAAARCRLLRVQHRHAGRRRAHLRHPEQIEEEIFAPSTSPRTCTTCSNGRASNVDAPGQQARHGREWDFTEAPWLRWTDARSTTRSTRRRRVLRAEDRPAQRRTSWAAPGKWARSSSTHRCRRGSV